MKNTKNDAKKELRAQREKMKTEGFFDGRFRTRQVQSKIHKQPKYKDSIFQ